MPSSAWKKFFFNDTATTEIYTGQTSSAASDVYKRQTESTTEGDDKNAEEQYEQMEPVSYTHLRAHET